MSLVTPTILSQGKEMDPAYGLVSIDIVKEVQDTGTVDGLHVEPEGPGRNVRVTGRT